MTRTASEDRFRQAAEAEDGMSVSAGARMAHLRLAVQAGRALFVDLAQIPDDRRQAVIAAIKELVTQASVATPQGRSEPVADTSNPST